jgi:hypothetical protein
MMEDVPVTTKGVHFTGEKFLEVDVEQPVF